MYKSEKIFLSPLFAKDKSILFEWINDKELVHLNNHYRPVSEINHQKWFESIQEDRHTVVFAIRTLDRQDLVGSCQLHSIDFISRHAELQIRLGGTNNLNKGYGTEAITLLLEYAKRDLNLRKVYLHVFSDNLRAIRVYKKCGFQEEGCLKDYSWINGHWKDELIMGKFLNEDFE